jgi:hypothetical protein
MIVQLLDGSCILSPSTSGPFVPTQFGQAPAGILHSETVGLGPGQFRLSAAIDADLVAQAWYAWISAASLPPPPLSYLVVNHGIPPLTQVVTFPAGIAVSVSVIAVGTPPALPTVVSTIDGAIAASATESIVEGGGDTATMAVFGWIATGGIDTLTIDSAGGNDVAAIVLSFIAATLDVSAGSTATGQTIGVSLGPVAAAGEIVVVNVAYLNLNSSTVWPPQVPYSGVGTQIVTSPDGSQWQMYAGWGWTVAGVNPIAVGIVTGNPIQPQVEGMIAQAFLVAAGSPPLGAIITVIEAFDIIDQPAPQQYLTVPLPTLNAAAIESLKELQAQILAKESVMEAPTDAG